MKQMLGGAVLALAVLGAAGCSAQPDPEAVERWMAQQAGEGSDARAQMTGLALEKSAVADSSVEDLGEQIRIDFDERAPIRSVEFRCFGADTMDVTVYLETSSGTVGVGAPDSRCAGSPVTIETGVTEAVGALAVVAANRDGAGAWAVLVD